MQPLGPSEVDADSIDVWVVSHGGVASNALCDHMQAQGIRTRPENYGLICHKQHPGISVVDIEVDMTGFALRERKKKYSPRSKDVKNILEIYQNYNFEE